MQPKRIYDVSEISYLWQLENLYLAGQPGPKTFLELKERGVKRVVNLRDASEGDFSFEEKLCRELGIEYVQFPIIVGGRLSVESCQRLNKMMEENKNEFIHCGTANRVGSWLITYLVAKKGLDFDDAVDIASNSGLTNPGFIDAAMMALEEMK